MPIGVPEMLIILVIALIVLGPKKLPEAGKSLGNTWQREGSYDLSVFGPNGFFRQFRGNVVEFPVHLVPNFHQAIEPPLQLPPVVRTELIRLVRRKQDLRQFTDGSVHIQRRCIAMLHVFGSLICNFAHRLTPATDANAP